MGIEKSAWLPAGWLMSAPNGTWRVEGPGQRRWVPYSTAHAREVGAALTACGTFAIGWELFWDMPFEGSGEDACSACANALASRAASANGSR